MEDNYDYSIHRNPDAKAWAKFFMECNPKSNIPEDIMHGWFANAMMAMHDCIMEDKMVLLYKDIPEFSEDLSCPDCGDEAERHIGYGIIGGGIGPYTMCAHCGVLISKSEDQMMCDTHEAVEIKDAEATPDVHDTKRDDDR